MKDKKQSKLIMGLIIGLTLIGIGVLAAPPETSELLVRILSWPDNVNVTLLNPPFFPNTLNVTITNPLVLPADTDGDGVPDSVDDFPNDPLYNTLVATLTINVDTTQGNPQSYPLPLFQSDVKDLRITFSGTRNVLLEYKTFRDFGSDCNPRVGFSQSGVVPYTVDSICSSGTGFAGTTFYLLSLRAEGQFQITVEALA